MKKEHLQSGRKRQKLATRKRILEAANELLKEGKALNMDDIAKKANISRATIYRYYSNTDSIATELILQLSVPDSEKLVEKFSGENLLKAMLGIQASHINFVLKNENPSKKFLGAFLSSSDPKLERGQNRITAVRNFLTLNEKKINDADKEKLATIAVLLMGVEAILVTKDVCGLNNKKSKETLQWAMEMLLKGCSLSE